VSCKLALNYERIMKSKVMAFFDDLNHMIRTRGFLGSILKIKKKKEKRKKKRRGTKCMRKGENRGHISNFYLISRIKF
jgi:ribosomal protein S14